MSENGDERRSFRGGGAPRSGGPRRDNDGRGSRGAAGGDRRGGAGDNNRGGAGTSNRGGGFNGGQRRGGEGGFTLVDATATATVSKYDLTNRICPTT